ncbi:MAG: hypothetical protein GMKNLPBB_00692 [Myxococcota bacterium]|nr:hypothetical protein [Myxococcota bacterium]
MGLKAREAVRGGFRLLPAAGDAYNPATPRPCRRGFMQSRSAMPKKLTPELAEAQTIIERHAKEAGLDCFETVFEVLDFQEMNMVAAYGGFPNRYPHWRFGMEYEHLSKSYRYGLSKIYEMVINSDPCYAYLLESNPMVDQKLVMAHVYGHCDFFKNNYCFAQTNRKMLDEMGNHAARVRRYIDRHGIEAVENFLDICLSIEDLIDPQAPHRVSASAEPPRDAEPETPREEYKLPSSRKYMNDYINPPEFLEEQRKKREAEQGKPRKFPAQPERDVMLFLMENAPLESWQQDVLSIIREEAYYFLPQMMTKIMNEGWASYWHSKLMTTKILRDAEVIDYACTHAGTMSTAGGRLNPYKLGIELFRHIEERWDRGQFGKEWLDCDDYVARQNWDKKLGLGRKKIFEVRKIHNDITFIDEFLTEDFAREQKLFSFSFNNDRSRWEIESREFKQVKQRLLQQLTNAGRPFIFVEDANFENRGELLLNHKWEGVDLDPGYARDTLRNIFQIWRRPVNLHSRTEEHGVLLTFNGREHSEKRMD